jgi:hypothetical protein
LAVILEAPSGHRLDAYQALGRSLDFLQSPLGASI